MTATAFTTVGRDRCFELILCGIDGSRGSGEAVREAIALAAPGGTVRFVAVTDVRGRGANRIASLGAHRAQQALNAARSLARSHGVNAEATLLHDDDVVTALLDRGVGHDLLVIGSRGEPRAGGILMGTVAAALIHRAEGPLLVARRAAAEAPFPERVLIAVRGDGDGEPLVRLGGGIASAAGGDAALVHVPIPGDGPRLAALRAELRKLTGAEPVVATPDGPPDRAIADLAAVVGASLVVIGRRRTGMRALGGISRRVAHRAPCSVLVLPVDEAQ